MWVSYRLAHVRRPADLTPARTPALGGRGSHCAFEPSPLQLFPHLAVALRGPDHRMVDPARLVKGPRDVEGQAMLVDGKIAKALVHRVSCRGEAFFQAQPLGHGRFGGAEERFEKVA